MGRRAKTDYENAIQIQKDEESEIKDNNNWYIEYKEFGGKYRIVLKISSGKSWSIMQQMGLTTAQYDGKLDTDVFLLTHAQLSEFIKLFVQGTKSVGEKIKRSRKTRSDKGKKARTTYTLSDEERRRRSERMKKYHNE